MDAIFLLNLSMYMHIRFKICWYEHIRTQSQSKEKSWSNFFSNHWEITKKILWKPYLFHCGGPYRIESSALIALQIKGLVSIWQVRPSWKWKMGILLFKVSNGRTRKIWKVCSKLTIKSSELRHWLVTGLQSHFWDITKRARKKHQGRFLQNKKNK